MKKIILTFVLFLSLFVFVSCDSGSLGNSNIDFDKVEVEENQVMLDNSSDKEDVLKLLDDMLNGKINYGYRNEDSVKVYIPDYGTFSFGKDDLGFIYDYLGNKLTYGKCIYFNAYTNDYCYEGWYAYDEDSCIEYEPIMKGLVCSASEVKALYVLNGDTYNEYNNSYITNILKQKDNSTFEVNNDNFTLTTEDYKVVTNGKTFMEIYSNDKLVQSYIFNDKEIVDLIKEKFNSFEFEKVNTFEELDLSEFSKTTKKDLETKAREYAKKFFEENATQNQELTVTEVKNVSDGYSIVLDRYVIKFDYYYVAEIFSNDVQYEMVTKCFDFSTERLELDKSKLNYYQNMDNGDMIFEIVANKADILDNKGNNLEEFEFKMNLILKSDCSYTGEIIIKAKVKDVDGKYAFDIESTYNETGTYKKTGTYDARTYEFNDDYVGKTKLKVSNFFAYDKFNNKFIDINLKEFVIEYDGVSSEFFSFINGYNKYYVNKK